MKKRKDPSPSSLDPPASLYIQLITHQTFPLCTLSQIQPTEARPALLPRNKSHRIRPFLLPQLPTCVTNNASIIILPSATYDTETIGNLQVIDDPLATPSTVFSWSIISSTDGSLAVDSNGKLKLGSKLIPGKSLEFIIVAVGNTVDDVVYEKFKVVMT